MAKRTNWKGTTPAPRERAENERRRRRRRRHKRLAICGAAVLGALAMTSGCAEPMPTFRPHQMQGLERAASTAVPVPRRRQMPTTLPSSAPTTRPVAGALGGPPGQGQEENFVRLTLREVIQRAVLNNPDIRVAGYEPAIDESRVVEAEAAFDPAYFASLQNQQQFILSPSASNNNVIDPFNPTGFRTQQFRTGFRQQLETGGQVEISYGTQRVRRLNTPSFGASDINPYYVNDVEVRLQQPLLRDFGAEVNRARLSIARNNQRVSLLEFRKTLEEQLNDLETAYWRLVEAQRQVQIQEELLDRSYETTRILQERLEAGADVNRAQLQLAAQATQGRIADLIRARARLRDLSDTVKRRMNDPDLPVLGNTVILPATDPMIDQIMFDFPDLIDAAYSYRFDLAQQQLRIDSSGIAERVAEKNLLPALNLQLQASFQGAGEEFADAFDAQLGFGNRNYTLGFDFEMPIGNRAARAVFRRAQLQRLQAIEQYRALLNTINEEVQVGYRDVVTSYEEILQRHTQVLVAGDSLEALLERERQGVEALSPAYIQTKLNAQENLAQAQSAEALAISNYNIAIAHLERSKGTLLRYDNVLMEEAPRGRSGDVDLDNIRQQLVKPYTRSPINLLIP
jgi:outer membrane protein TolC